MTVSVEETLCACWKGWYKWLTVHFLDDLKYVVILNHGNWHSHEYVRFKNSEREREFTWLTSLDSGVQDMTCKLETLLANSKKKISGAMLSTLASPRYYSRTRRKISERQFGIKKRWRERIDLGNTLSWGSISMHREVWGSFFCKNPLEQFYRTF